MDFGNLKPLHGLGLSLHWLHPKSKRPIGNNWPTVERRSWEHLTKTFKKGNNIGVRTGVNSKLPDGTYLVILDIDVKSPDPKDASTAYKIAEKFIGKRLAECPCVKSGRGGASLHVYCRVEKAAASYNIARSEKSVKVKMPSVPPGKKEIAALTDQEISEGLRIRSAYEIDLLSDGKQAAIPPSIHPDTNREYMWGDTSWFEQKGGYKRLPLIKPEDFKSLPKLDTSYKVEFQQVDLTEIKMSAKALGLIKELDGLEEYEHDRSKALYYVMNELVFRKLTNTQMVSILTDPSNAISEVALSRAGNSFERASRWLLKQIEKMRGISGVQKEFSEPVEEDLFAGTDWKYVDPKTVENKLFEKARKAGFYKSQGGKKSPDYFFLLKAFEKAHPFKTIADMRVVYTYKDFHYQAVTPIEIKAFAEKTLRPAPQDRARLEFLAKVFSNGVTTRAFFTNTTEGKFNFNNGILDLKSKSKELLPHSPEFGFRNILPYEYDPKAKCPIFLDWLKNIMLGDETLIMILQEFMGYVVRGGEYRYHKALWLGGKGRNGKSTFIDVLKALIGAGNYSTISIKSLMTDRFAGSELDGKIANFSEETSPQELADSGPFKNLTGDGDISAQKKFGDLFFFRNRAKLIMTYNQIPDLKDLSDGMLSRPIIIPFKKRIKDSEQDKKLKEKLLKELPGIFNFALEGWERLESQNDFTQSDSSKGALETVKKESCNVFQWIENYLTFVDDKAEEYRKKPQELYAAYRSHEHYPYRIAEFCRRLNRHPEMKKRRHKTNGKRGYFGIKNGY